VRVYLRSKDLALSRAAEAGRRPGRSRTGSRSVGPPWGLQVLTIIRPETLIHWHRAGFCCYWRWKSRSLGGRPPIEARLRALIRQMSMNNPFWGAPRIYGELLKLGFEDTAVRLSEGHILDFHS
jgi:hypothetical protein